MIHNTPAVDDLDYRLTTAINTSYGIGISSSTPVVRGAVIPKIQVGGLHTTNIQIYGSVQTPLRLTHDLTTETGDLVLTATTGRIDFGGASFANYTTPPRNFIDLTYQGVSPDPPMSNTLRIYANSGGLLAWKAPSGIIARLDASGLSANRVFTLPDGDTEIAGIDVAQTFTNKTIDTAAPNTVRIGGVAIGSLIGQDVRSSASPTFNAFSTIGVFNEFGGKFTAIHGAITTTDGNFARIVTTTIPMPSDVTRVMVVYVMAFCSAGANLNGSVGQRVIVRITTTSGLMNIAQTSSLAINTFPSNLTVTDQGGGIVGIRITGIAGNTIRWIAYAEIYDES